MRTGTHRWLPMVKFDQVGQVEVAKVQLGMGCGPAWYVINQSYIALNNALWILERGGERRKDFFLNASQIWIRCNCENAERLKKFESSEKIKSTLISWYVAYFYFYHGIVSIYFLIVACSINFPIFHLYCYHFLFLNRSSSTSSRRTTRLGVLKKWRSGVMKFFRHSSPKTP